MVRRRRRPPDAGASRVEEQLRTAQAEIASARYESIIESSDEAISTWTPDGTIVSWNPAAEQLYGYRQDEVIGRPVAILVPRERGGEIAAIIERLNEGQRVDHYETVRVRKDGSQIDVSVTDSAIRDAAGHLVGVTAIAHDCGAAKRAEQTLLRSRAQLRAFAGRLRAAREDERTLIARQIHDDLGQALTALKMDLFSFANSVVEGQRHDLAPKVHDMAMLIDGLVDSVRTLATELRPAVLDSMGLRAAIEWAVQQFAYRTGIRCALDLPPDPVEVDADRSTDVFRILQEALTNVTRHAAATELDVQLRVTPGEIVLEVRDNGRGITASEIDDPHAFGLLGMRERALQWGGEVGIRAAPRGGTCVTTCIPLTPHAPEAVT